MSSLLVVNPKRVNIRPSQANAGTSKSLPSEGDLEARKYQVDTLEQDTMGKSWLDALQPEFKKPYFTQLKGFLTSEYASHTVYPSSNVFRLEKRSLTLTVTVSWECVLVV